MQSLCITVILLWTTRMSLAFVSCQNNGQSMCKKSRLVQDAPSKIFSLLSTVSSSTDLTPSSSSSQLKKPLQIAIVGAGPSGLLLAHKLLLAQQNKKNHHRNNTIGHIEILEARPPPTTTAMSSTRSYALGVGIRGRMAIQDDHDTALWNRVKAVGFASETFDLHVGSSVRVRLRDTTQSAELEPSLLLFQSDLCAAMLEQVLAANNNNNNESGQPSVNVRFHTPVTSVDLERKQLTYQTTVSNNENDNESTTTTTQGLLDFDVVVGCDGVNSVVRQAMEDTSDDTFEATRELLPGQFKAVRLPRMPQTENSKIDPTAVSLILPKAGSVTAFIEPTRDETCCILFAGGKDATDPLLNSSNTTELVELLTERFPFLLNNKDNDDSSFSLIPTIATQLASQTRASQASKVICNIYHYGESAVLCGDAAHATGGVSGQGVNSALVDSKVLAECLMQDQPVRQALLQYSQRQVPEGKALYDLSFPPTPTGTWQKLKQTFRRARDTIFQGRWGIGRPPIQTVLTTSTKSFADIRRERQVEYNGIEFPSQAWWEDHLADLDAKVKERSTSIA